MTADLCLACGSPSHTAKDCDDEVASFGLTNAFARGAAHSPPRVSTPRIRLASSCGVLRIQADYRDGGNANIIEGSARGDAGVVVLSGRCECEVFKVDGILCPPSLEESLALEGISVDGADRLRSLYVSNPPPLWALRKASLDVPVAQLGSLFEVRLRLLKPCAPDIALTGRILR